MALDKALNFLVERTAAFGVRKTTAHDLAGQPVHFRHDLFDAPMFANGLFQPLGLFGREREADGFRFHFARPREARTGLAERSAINRAGAQITDARELLPMSCADFRRR